MIRLILLAVFGGSLVLGSHLEKAFDSDGLHPKFATGKAVPPEEQDSNYWIKKAQNTVLANLQRIPNIRKAKNIILFLGDGMSIPTLAAARMYQTEISGQREGEGNHLSFEDFPYTGLAMTACIDTQVADSACTSTAYLGGVKANIGTIGVNGRVARGDCRAMRNTSNHVSSIAHWAQQAGKWTGIVSNARITHASPAGAYAHVADRDWESDVEVTAYGEDSSKCDDIARQLMKNKPGKNFNVILGGGRSNFIPNTEDDPVAGRGKRLDGENLIDAWKAHRKANNDAASYVWTRKQLLNLPKNTTHVLGLFNQEHLSFRLYNNTKEPSVTEMTETAIKLLQMSEKGFFLFVEGAEIDFGHHYNLPRIALDETVEFSNAIRRAVELTNEKDTLIVVTADHAHTMSISGYADRSKSVFANADVANDGVPYPVLSYANGPGYKTPVNNERPFISEEDLAKVDFQYPTTAPLPIETHGGDDVAVFAQGPWAHLLQGSNDQNLIPHVMAFASCIGPGYTLCSRP